VEISWAFKEFNDPNDHGVMCDRQRKVCCLMSYPRKPTNYCDHVRWRKTGMEMRRVFGSIVLIGFVCTIVGAQARTHTKKILQEAGRVAQTTKLIYDKRTRSTKVIGPPRRIPTGLEGIQNFRVGTWYLHATCDNKALGRLQMTAMLARSNYKRGWIHFDSAYIDGASIPVTHEGYFPHLEEKFFGEQLLLDFSAEDLKKFAEMKTVKIKVTSGHLGGNDRAFGIPISGAYFLGFLRALEREGIDMAPQQITNTRQQQ